MRRWFFLLPAVGLPVLMLAACAASPRAQQQAAFGRYWDCAFAAARPHLYDMRLSAREAAMRAQAQCYDRYVDYQHASGDYVRSVVAADSHEMATSLADHSALQKKRYVTGRLTDWVDDTRRTRR